MPPDTFFFFSPLHFTHTNRTKTPPFLPFRSRQEVRRRRRTEAVQAARRTGAFSFVFFFFPKNTNHHGWIFRQPATLSFFTRGPARRSSSRTPGMGPAPARSPPPHSSCGHEGTGTLMGGGRGPTEKKHRFLTQPHPSILFRQASCRPRTLPPVTAALKRLEEKGACALNGVALPSQPATVTVERRTFSSFILKK